MLNNSHLSIYKGVPVVEINDDFGCILNCAVRYSMGRQTYMPHTVMHYIKPLLPYLNNKTLFCIERDIREANDLGHETIDRPEWENFLKEVQKELSVRENT